MSSEKEELKPEVEESSALYLTETIQSLQREVENLEFRLRRAKRSQPLKIGVVFTVTGVTILALSIIYYSQILAFIGLGFSFWGALFFFARPKMFVQSSVLDSTVTSAYSTLSRVVKDLKYKREGYYIPPYPKEVYLPEHLKGLKDMVVFIPASGNVVIPSLEEMAKEKFLIKKPKGVCVVPPGLELAVLIEKELRADFTKLELNELCEILSKPVVQNLQLAKDLEFKVEENEVWLGISESIYRRLYIQEEEENSAYFLGGPLASAIACALAKSSGKVVTLQVENNSLDAQKIEVTYSLIEG